MMQRAGLFPLHKGSRENRGLFIMLFVILPRSLFLGTIRERFPLSFSLWLFEFSFFEYIFTFVIWALCLV